MKKNVLLLLVPALAVGCATGSSERRAETTTTTTSTTTTTEAAVPAPPPAPAKEPDHIEVQHILIGFTGSVPGKGITRSKDEAKTRAYMVLSKAKEGADYDALVREYTDDSFPGRYKMSNNGVSAEAGEYPRGRMVPAFGNVGFKLAVGEIGIADFDPKTSPFGWHIVKRVE